VTRAGRAGRTACCPRRHADVAKCTGGVVSSGGGDGGCADGGAGRALKKRGTASRGGGGGTRSCRARQSRALRPRAPRRPQLSVSRLECRGGCGARFEGGLSSRSPAQIDGGATVRVAGGGPRPRGLRILRRASWWGWPIGEGRS